MNTARIFRPPMPTLTPTLGPTLILALILAAFPALSLLTANRAVAAPLVLADEDIGYSMTLPEGWQPLAPQIVANLAGGLAALMDVAMSDTDRQMIKGAQSESNISAARIIVVMPLSLTALKPTKADLDSIASGDVSALEKVRSEIAGQYAAMGGKVFDSRTFKGGLKVVASIPAPGMPDNAHIFQAMYMRFTKDNMIVCLGMYSGPASDVFDPQVAVALESLTIADDKKL